MSVSAEASTFTAIVRDQLRRDGSVGSSIHSDVPSTGLYNSPSQYESGGQTKNFKDAQQGSTELFSLRKKQVGLGRKKKLHGLKRQRG
jgi:hypothetical protein